MLKYYIYFFSICTIYLKCLKYVNYNAKCDMKPHKCFQNLVFYIRNAMPARVLSGRAGGAEVSVADSPLATFESLTQAAVIAVMGVAIVVSNLLIIAAFLNFKGIILYFQSYEYVKLIKARDKTEQCYL